MKKQILSALLASLLLLSACGNGSASPSSVPIITEDYDWVAAREQIKGDFAGCLVSVAAGNQSDYDRTKTEWAGKISPDAHASIFSAYPPANTSASVRYLGYSGPDFNSDNSEYLAYRVTRLDKETLTSVAVKVFIRLEKGNVGYYIAEYKQQVL